MNIAIFGVATVVAGENIAIFWVATMVAGGNIAIFEGDSVVKVLAASECVNVSYIGIVCNATMGL